MEFKCQFHDSDQSNQQQKRNSSALKAHKNFESFNKLKQKNIDSLQIYKLHTSILNI